MVKELGRKRKDTSALEAEWPSHGTESSQIFLKVVHEVATSVFTKNVRH